MKMRKAQIGEYENLKSRLKKLKQILALTSNEVHLKKIKKKSTKILQKIENIADQQLNKNEEVIYVKKIMLDKLRYRSIKMKRIKIRDARMHSNRIQGMFYRKIQGAKQLKQKNGET